MSIVNTVGISIEVGIVDISMYTIYSEYTECREWVDVVYRQCGVGCQIGTQGANTQRFVP